MADLYETVPLSHLRRAMAERDRYREALADLVAERDGYREALETIVNIHESGLPEVMLYTNARVIARQALGPVSNMPQHQAVPDSDTGR